MTIAEEVSKEPLDDRQHAEMLLFAQSNLQDIRDMKANQRQAVVGGLALLGALVGLWEKLDSAPDWAQYLLGLLLVTVMVGAGAVVVAQQNDLLRFRRRQQRILDHLFVLELRFITGSPRAYGSADESRAFSVMADMVPLYLALLAGGGAVALTWIFTT